MYKSAVIGLGNIGLLYDLEPQRPHPSTHVAAYEMSPDFQLTCAIDNDKAKESILHKLSPGAVYLSDLDEGIKSGLMKEVDVVSICTPPSTHLDILLKLIDSRIGKIIFCEKPVVANADQACRLIKAVSDSGIVVIPNISRRWNTGLRKVARILESNELGKLEKINIRYTRGIYNTGAHLFDLLRMWTGSPISEVMTLSETNTSAHPERTFSFWFKQKDDVTGYAEAIDDRSYYQFDIDLYCSAGKIEMRNSGDEIRYYSTSQHHLFADFEELKIVSCETDLLKDACIKNAIDNIKGTLDGKEEPGCKLEDAIYPLHVAKALEESYKSKSYVEVTL